MEEMESNKFSAKTVELHHGDLTVLAGDMVCGQPTVFMCFSSFSDATFMILLSMYVLSSNLYLVLTCPKFQTHYHLPILHLHWVSCPASCSDYMAESAFTVLRPGSEESSVFLPEIFIDTITHSLSSTRNLSNLGLLLPHYFPHLIPSSLDFNFF